MDRIAKYIQELKQVLDQLPLEKIDQVITILHEARLYGRQVFIMGSGSSASVASQFVADLSKITHQKDWPGFKVIGLSDHAFLLSAVSEDQDYEDTIANQIDSMLTRGDVVIGISPSGDTKYILKAIEIANHKGATTIGFTGFDGGRLVYLADVTIQAPTENREHIEDVLLVLENMITQVLREEAQQKSYSRKFDKTPPGQHPPIRPAILKNLPIHASLDGLNVERSRASVDMFSEISRELSYEMDLPEFLNRILLMMINRLKASSGTIVVFNERGEAVEGAVAFKGEVKQYVAQQYREIIQRGLAGWVLQNRQAALISNTRDDPRWLTRPWEEESGNTRSAICVPLVEENRVVGILTLASEQAGTFSEKDLSLLAAVAMFITLVNYAL
jgi:D-sedoheptulose 7-phosphate isomerase